MWTAWKRGKNRITYHDKYLSSNLYKYKSVSVQLIADQTVCLHFQIKIDLQVLDNPTQKSNRNQLWAIIIRPTFPFFSGPKFELLCESCLGLLSLLCGIILCEPHCQSRFWNPTPLPVRLKFSGFFLGLSLLPLLQGYDHRGRGMLLFFGHRGSLAKMRGAGSKLNI